MGSPRAAALFSGILANALPLKLSSDCARLKQRIVSDEGDEIFTVRGKAIVEVSEDSVARFGGGVIFFEKVE